MTARCSWPGSNPLMIQYHDTEWGVPVTDDRKLFEYLVLDAFQAGLSWSIVLKKREAFRSSLDGFDPEIIAGYPLEKLEQLARNPAIIRNRSKLKATVSNARAFLAVQNEFGSFSKFLWDINGPPRHNAFKTEAEIPASTPASDRLSRELKQRGFSFVGTTICYAFMQAAGLVNDHLVSCFRYSEINRESPSL
ncbi:MAG: DNA-3-methyladenine glycosylase I [FCB group bacterium]|nr:DNA-3-methyladenine glycosylase I [FCB group bacterium]